MRRLCVVRSDGDPQSIACSQIIHVKANPYKTPAFLSCKFFLTKTLGLDKIITECCVKLIGCQVGRRSRDETAPP